MRKFYSVKGQDQLLKKTFYFNKTKQYNNKILMNKLLDSFKRMYDKHLKFKYTK